jgi:hypothetical protein
MSSLIINRVHFQLTEEIPNLYISTSLNLPFMMQFRNLKKRLYLHKIDNLNILGNLSDDEKVKFSFIQPANGNYLTLNEEQYSFNYFKPKYVRQLLCQHFDEYIINVNPKGCDLSIYEKIHAFDSDWNIYKRIDFSIKPRRNEIAFNIGSEKTLVSNEVIAATNVKVIEDKRVRGLAENESGNFIVIANREIKEGLGINKTTPKKLSYKAIYTELTKFYNEILLQLSNEKISILAGGLRNVETYDINKVNTSENLMLFGNERTDINAVTGLRDYGIYRPSPKATEVKFVFVYQNKSDANQLYLYLKNGYKHYPGLWSYVGIPISRLEPEKSLQYTSDNELRNKIDGYLNSQFPNDYYNDYFAIIIQPYSSQDREDIEEEDNELYYLIKHKFLSKGIPTQFIQDKNIHSGSFHYYLPNISIAILAKLGGIPWRLKSKKNNELVIGFNQKKTAQGRFIGSAVFFSNEGQLGKTLGFIETETESALIKNLKASIEEFIREKQSTPERLIIHYYKPQSGSEKESIESLIQQELRLNIPFAIVEINDSKSQMDICFDVGYDMGMPESGTFIRMGKTEYLLFNNLRYQRNPIRSIVEELPIKIVIHFADTGGFSHNELISQVYEFSRLYWKGLKQRSQPATTIYAKLIADFASHYNGQLPDNDTVNTLPWFL